MGTTAEGRSCTELLLPMPPSVNALYANVRNVGRVRTKAYRAWLSEAGWELLRQRPRPIKGRYHLRIFAARKQNRADLGNREKAISDLLVKHQVVSDDSVAETIQLSWSDDVKSGWVRLELEPA